MLKRNERKTFVSKVLFVMLCILFTNISIIASPVDDYGQLKIVNGQLCSENGNAIQLKGMSLFWNNYDYVSYWQPSVVKNMATDWNMNIIRLAMGAGDKNEQLTEKSYNYMKSEYDDDIAEVSKMVDAAIEAGIYVIIDWHGHFAKDHKADAKSFFGTMAKKYGDKPNVFYEIWNEPLVKDNWGVIKPYAEEIITEIRKYDSDNIVLVGTQSFCQHPEAVIGNKINDANVMYTIHAYVSTHTPYGSERTNFNKALSSKIPLFMSEWGTCSADGGGSFDKTNSDNWIKWMSDNKISWCNWAIFNKNEAASALNLDASSDGLWTESDLSASGKYIFDILKSDNPKYIDKTSIEIIEAKYAGNIIYLSVNKRLTTPKTSDFTVEGYTITNVQLKGSINNEILITLSKIITDLSTIKVSLKDVYNESSMNKSISVERNLAELPLKINIGDNKSVDVPEFGFVKEKLYEEGSSSWGTLWYDNHGGTNRASLDPAYYSGATDFYEGYPELDDIMGIYMYGIKGINVCVKNGTYKFLIFGLETNINNSESGVDPVHGFDIKIEDNVVEENFEAYKDTEEKYKIAAREFIVEVNDGILNAEFIGVGDSPQLSAIVIGDENYQWSFDMPKVVGQPDAVFFEEKNTDLIAVFPNPFNNYLKIISNSKNSMVKSVVVYDSRGVIVKELFDLNLDNIISKIDMSDLKTGVYYLKIENNNEEIIKSVLKLK